MRSEKHRRLRGVARALISRARSIRKANGRSRCMDLMMVV